MKDFNYCAPTRVIFGKNTELEVGKALKNAGATRVLMQYGGGSIKKSGLYDRVVKAIRDEGIELFELGGVQPNPHLSLVRKAIEIVREQKIDYLLAVGGGSAIDSTKATAVGAVYDGDVWDFYCGKAVPKKAMPVGVVLTIPAAGSEGSNSSVITNEDGWIKRGLGCDLTRPAFAIYNPELTYSLPAYQTAAGATDMMAHIMERYFTNEPDVDMTDRLCESVLKTIIRQAPVAVKEPDNYVARAEMMWASTVAHNDFLSCFRVGDWSSHQLSHELSGMYDATHGAALAVAFPAWMTYVYKHDVQRFCRFAVEVMGVEMDFFHPEETALKGIAALRAFFKSIGMPTTLSELGVPEDKLDVLADKVKRGADGTTGQFVKLTRDDCLKIYQLMR